MIEGRLIVTLRQRRPYATSDSPRNQDPRSREAIIAQVDGSGTIGIGPSVLVVSEIVESAVGGAGSVNVTSYRSVIEYGVRASTTVAAGLLVPIEVNVAVASGVPVP